MIARRFTRHSFNRAFWLRARRPERLVAIDAGGCAPPVIAADEPYRAPPINLRDAPSSMEMRAAGWRRG